MRDITKQINLPDGTTLRTETAYMVHQHPNGGVVEVLGPERFYVNDREVTFWDYAPATGEVKVIERA